MCIQSHLYLTCLYSIGVEAVKEMDRHRLQTFPNLLTLLRPVCTGPFVLLCTQAQQSATSWTRWGALLVFLLIVGSDVLDGWWARKLDQASPFGRALDHGCDVLFILIALGFFVSHGLVPWWLPAAIAWAFALYVLDSWWRTTEQPQRSLVASRLGHLSGILNYIAVGLVTANVCTDPMLFSRPFLQGYFTVLALLALTSGGERLYQTLRFWRHLPPGAPTGEKPDQSDRSTP